MTKTLDIDPAIPLVVDLDRALALSDPAWEGFARLLFANPAAALAAIPGVARSGTAKEQAALRHGPLEPTRLPLRAELVALLQAEKARGRALHLISAADQRTVEAVAAALPLFGSAAGRDGTHPVANWNKLEAVRGRFADGFLYAG